MGVCRCGAHVRGHHGRAAHVSPPREVQRRIDPARLSDRPADLPERTLYWEFGKQAGDPNSGIVGEVFQAARRGPRKAVRYGMDAEVELDHIENDPGETNELSEQQPDEHQKFVSLFEEHKGYRTQGLNNTGFRERRRSTIGKHLALTTSCQ